MGRPKGKTTVPTSISLNKDVLARLKAYSAETMVPTTKVIEKSVTKYLDELGFKSEVIHM